MRTHRRYVLASALVIFGLVALAYIPGLYAPFAYDDKPNILLLPGAQPDDWSDLDEALGHPTRQDRPVARLTFALNYLVTGLDPAGFRSVNIAIHAATACLLYALVLALSRAPNAGFSVFRHRHAIALASAFIWALEPVQTQAVTYIVQRMTSLAALFYLAAALVFVYWRLGHLRDRWALPLLILLWAAAVGCKGHAVTAPATLILLEIAFFTGWTRRNLVVGGGIILAGASAMGVFLLYNPAHLIEDTARGFSVVDRLLTQPRVLWHYLSLLVWPDAERLRVKYDIVASQGLITPWTTLPALLALVVATAAALVYLRRLPWLAVGWLFWLVGHSVESSVILLALAFEHRIYLPSTLLVTGVVATIFTAWPARAPRPALHVLVLLGAGLLAYQTIERNRVWSDLPSLWGQDVAKGADPAGVGRNAALAALAKGRPERALRILGGVHAEEAHVQAKIEMIRAEALLLTGELDRAEAKLQSILAQYARAAVPHYLYVRVLLAQGRLRDARDMAVRMETFVADSPYTPMARAEVARRSGDPDLAVSLIRDWLTSHGSVSTQTKNGVRLHLAHTYATSGRGDRAATIYRQILASNPQAWNAWRGLLRVLEAGRSSDEAARIRKHLREHGVNPDLGRRPTSTGAALPTPRPRSMSTGARRLSRRNEGKRNTREPSHATTLASATINHTPDTRSRFRLRWCRGRCCGPLRS